MIEKLFNNPNYGMTKTMLDVTTARHDALAAKSAEMGKTSAEFRAGARRKAKATMATRLRRKFSLGRTANPGRQP